MATGRRRTGPPAGRARGAATVAVMALLALAIAACGGEDPVTIGLIVKRDSNPFFVTIRDTARRVAERDDVELLTAAGRSDVDNASQVAAIERMTDDGAKGILIIPSDSRRIVPAIERARLSGVIVIALDSPTDPESAVDAIFATDNRRAGELIGRYARAKAEELGIEPRIGMLDLAPGIKIGRQRHDGFLAGFGIEEGDSRIAGMVNSEGDRVKGRLGMEQLLTADPDINVVYAINEPAALGAATALEDAGKDPDDVILVAIDGGCDAIREGIATGMIDATAQQYPGAMATEGIDAIVGAVRRGEQPSGFEDTGVSLITADPAPGVRSRDLAFGERHCWG